MVNMLKVMIAAIVLVFLLSMIFLGKRAKKMLSFKSAKTERSESKWIEAITGSLVVIMAVAYYWKSEPEANVAMWIGVLVFILGGILQIIAKKQLAGTLEEDFGKQKGVYSFLRHPSKSALLLMLIGLCLATASWWALLVCVVFFIPSELFRISQEEIVLLDKHGDEWMIYESDTNKLVPGII